MIIIVISTCLVPSGSVMFFPYPRSKFLLMKWFFATETIGNSTGDDAYYVYDSIYNIAEKNNRVIERVHRTCKLEILRDIEIQRDIGIVIVISPENRILVTIIYYDNPSFRQNKVTDLRGGGDMAIPPWTFFCFFFLLKTS